MTPRPEGLATLRELLTLAHSIGQASMKAEVVAQELHGWPEQESLRSLNKQLAKLYRDYTYTAERHAADLHKPASPSASPPIQAGYPPEPFGERLRRIRQEKGHTLTALAQLSGIPRGSLAQWEGSRREPGFSFVVKLAKALEVPLNSFEGVFDEREDKEGELN